MSTALYTDTGKVAAALAIQSPETLAAPVSTGATSITLNQAPPADWQVGATLILDANNPTLREMVTITGAPSGANVSVSATVNAHVLGIPVVNGTLLANYPGSASRMFDSLTYTPAGFAYETVTEIKSAYYANNGLIVVPLSKPVVAIGDVISAIFQIDPLNPANTLDLTKAWVRDGYILEIVPAQSYCRHEGMATVTYKGGYSPVPDDIALAVTMLAARLYKERDSGYSDVIGNSDMGIVQYKKALPADVAAIVQKYRRWTE